MDGKASRAELYGAGDGAGCQLLENWEALRMSGFLAIAEEWQEVNCT